MEIDYDEELDDFQKAIGQYRLTLNGLLKPLRLHGQGEYVDMATEELVKLGFQLYLRLSGVDIPFEVDDIHW